MLDANNSLTLWQNHPELENIELYEDSWQSPIEVKNALSKMTNITSLRTSPESAAGLKSVDKIIANIRTIVSFHLDLRTFCLPSSKDAYPVPNKLFSTAISASMKLNRNLHWKMPWTQLALWNVDLGSSSCAMWARGLDSAPLQVVEFSHCPYVENLLAAMASDSRNPNVESLTIYHQTPSAADGHRLCDALERYLERDSPLSNLVVRIKNLPVYLPGRRSQYTVQTLKCFSSI